VTPVCWTAARRDDGSAAVWLSPNSSPAVLPCRRAINGVYAAALNIPSGAALEQTEHWRARRAWFGARTCAPGGFHASPPLKRFRWRCTAGLTRNGSARAALPRRYATCAFFYQQPFGRAARRGGAPAVLPSNSGIASIAYHKRWFLTLRIFLFACMPACYPMPFFFVSPVACGRRISPCSYMPYVPSPAHCSVTWWFICLPLRVKTKCYKLFCRLACAAMPLYGALDCCTGVGRYVAAGLKHAADANVGHPRQRRFLRSHTCAALFATLAALFPSAMLCPAFASAFTLPLLLRAQHCTLS